MLLLLTKWLTRIGTFRPVAGLRNWWKRCALTSGTMGRHMLYVAGLGWLCAALLGYMYLQKRDDLAEGRELCNTQKAQAVAEAERITREVTAAAMQENLARMEQMVAQERMARQRADEARIIAEDRAATVRTIIREISSEDPQSCLNDSVPPAILDGMRNPDSH